MTDFYKLAQQYAVYTPSTQLHSAQRVIKQAVSFREGLLPAGLKMTDFNYLDPTNRFWSYGCCLATAGQFKNSPMDAVSNRKLDSTWVLGDSAGYQIGTGALAEIKPWMKHINNPELVMQLWREHNVKREIFAWLSNNCDWAMTLDMPLWMKGSDKTAFKNCTTQQLIELSVENLTYFSANRSRFRNLKLASTLQGETIEQEQMWFDAVKPYPVNGWALAGHVGQMGGIYRVLRRLLMLRDLKMLGGDYELVHILRLSRLRWAPVVTAVQQAVRETTNSPSFRITFDSSSPYRVAGVTTQYMVTAPLGDKLKGWTMAAHALPVGYGIANTAEPIALHTASTILPVPFDSPIAPLLTLQDLQPKKGAYDVRNIDQFTDEVMINQNVYAYVNSTIRANQAVFGPKPAAPQIIMDAVGIVQDLFRAQNWASMLEAKRGVLAKAVGDKAIKHAS